MNDTVLVSVIMTAYNREEFIGEAIQSVLSSTYKNFELIIVDDCSADSTVEIVTGFQLKDDRIRLYVNEKNLGQFANRNKAASYATGEYIKFFDSDDVMKNDLLQKTMMAMMAFPNASLGIECTWPEIPVKSLPVVFTSREAYINHFFKGNDFLHFGPSSTVIKKNMFDKCGGFDEQIGILADTLLMLKLAAKSPVVAYQPNLFYWRRHDGQVTIDQNDQYAMFTQRQEIRTLVLAGEVPLSDIEKNIIKQNYKSIFIRNIPRYILSIKSFKKLFNMFTLMDIKWLDFLHALKKNKIINH